MTTPRTGRIGPPIRASSMHPKTAIAVWHVEIPVQRRGQLMDAVTDVARRPRPLADEPLGPKPARQTRDDQTEPYRPQRGRRFAHRSLLYCAFAALRSASRVARPARRIAPAAARRHPVARTGGTRPVWPDAS